MTDVLYVENLAAAEELVRRGQFNAAKVLRALAHAQRAEAMARARNSGVDLPDLLRRNHTTLTDAPARDIAARALASLAHHVDVAESDVDQHIWGCYGCGRLVEGDRPDSCPACGALAVEFEWFGPFYAANPEHRGQQSPADVLAMLRRTPDEVAGVLDGRALPRFPLAWRRSPLLVRALEARVHDGVQLLLTQLGTIGRRISGDSRPQQPGNLRALDREPPASPADERLALHRPCGSADPGPGSVRHRASRPGRQGEDGPPPRRA